MKAIRWAAVAATALMSLMNLPIAFGGSDEDIPTGLAWAVTVLGAAGLVAAYGLARRQAWGRPAVVAVGLLNVAGAIVALTQSWEGGVIGLVVALLGTLLGAAVQPTREPAPALG
jgi:peptidoglycan/LPS O-acetylase OafA/YrhL